MALRIMDRSSVAVEVFPGVLKRALVRFDEFFGSAAALIAAEVLLPKDLEPQKGRAEGSTAFLPNGEPCPVHVRAWREPGFKAVRRQDDGSFKVQITVSREEHIARQNEQEAAWHEAEQEAINREILERGQEFTNRPLKQSFTRFGETWEGTKEQLQAAGLGIGMMFPGEPGAGEKVHCKCPLGFDFVVSVPRHHRVKAAAGIYEADSSYVPRAKEEKLLLDWAPGVTCEDWETRTYAHEVDIFHGTAEALVAAGLVPSVALFPGRGGANKVQASYRVGWSPATTSNSPDFLATIKKQGKKNLYILETPVSADEAARRRLIRERQDAEAAALLEQRLEERRQLRKCAAGTKLTARDFRLESSKRAEAYIHLIQHDIFARVEGALRFDVHKSSDLQKRLEEAFQVIRRVVGSAAITVDEKFETAARERLQLAAARNNRGLQTLLAGANGLTLVHCEQQDLKDK